MKKLDFIGGVNIFSSIKDMYESKQDFNKVRESEETKRNASNNITKENIEIIHAQRDLILKNLDNSFEIKKAQTCKTFDVIDHAIKEGNIEFLKTGLDAMVSISIDTSLPTLSDTQKLLDKNSVIDI